MLRSLGHDTEMFPLNAADGSIGSAIGLIGGSKEHPLVVEGGMLQEDNTSAEFGIDPVMGVTSDNVKEKAAEFCARTWNVRARMEAMVGPCVLQTTHEYEKEVLMSFGPAAMQFGCSPDYDAWRRDINEAPSPFVCLRTLGGHPHLGYPNPSMGVSAQITKLCDVAMGVRSVLDDPDRKRRTMYGKAGSFRPKPYGMEYRVLPSYWIGTDELMTWVCESMIWASDNHEQADDIVEAVGGSDKIVATINNYQVKEAEEICNRLEVLNAAA